MFLGKHISWSCLQIKNIFLSNECPGGLAAVPPSSGGGVSQSASTLVGSVRTLEKLSMHLHRCSPGEREGGTLSHPLLSPFGHPSPRRRALLLPPPQPRPHRTCQVTNLRPPTPAPLCRPGSPLLDWPRVRWSASNRQPSCATSSRSSRPAGLAGAQLLCDWCSRRSLSAR